MLILGIESSCDETAIALVADGRLQGSVLASQAELHSLFGGVVPELASREHYRFIGPLFDKLMQGVDARSLDAVAIARGPGLLGSLLVGMAFAKGLALALGIPLIGVNHLHAHLLAAGLEHPLAYPALGLLASGGHTHLYRIEAPWKFIQLGACLDDAAGEAFDKTGHLLGLPYPAGREIDRLARQGAPDPHLLPRPYLDNDNLDFSFSGLKTAAALLAGEKLARADASLNDFCASFNLAVAQTLAAKTKKALQRQKDVRAIWLAGGVAANSCVRDEMTCLARDNNLELLAPSPALCTDNAAMIAYAGWLLFRQGFYHNLELEAVPRGRKIPDDMLFGGQA